MKKFEGRYDKYDKEDQSSVNLTRTLTPPEVLNLRNKDYIEIPTKEIFESNSNIIVLGFNKITKITYMPEKIIKLELKSNLISKIQNLESCLLLQILDLSNNRILKIENLNNNAFLQELHLGDNHIKKIENLEMLRDLKRLNIENNMLSSTASIRTLSLNIKLTHLVVKGNPIAVQGKYKPTIISLLPKLLFLDYARIQSSGFKKNEYCAEFFSQPFLETDANIHLHTEITPKSHAKGIKSSKKLDSVQISIETQTFHPNTSTRADAEVQTFQDDVFKESSFKNSKEIKLPQFKNSNSNEMGKIKRYFRAVNIFKELPNTFIETLIKTSEYKVSQESEIIMYADSIVEKLIIINKGSIQYLNKIYNYGNYLFSESLVIPEEVKSDVICKENTEYFILQKQELEKLLRLFPSYRELIMKNYLEKNMSITDFEVKLKSNTQKKAFDKKKSAKPREKSKSLSKLNLKSLIASRTSKDLGLATLETDGGVEDSLINKVKKDIDNLLKSADPFDFSLEPHDKPENVPPEYSELSEKVESLYTIYLKDIQLAKSRQLIEEEAKEFLQTGYKSDVELIAMERESLKKLISSSNIEENPENMWMYEYVKSLDRATEDIKGILALKSAEVREEIFSCQSALQTFLNQSSSSLSVNTVKNYKIILHDCELLKIYDDPQAIIHEICGSYFSSPGVKQAAEEVINLMILANRLKESLSMVIKAQESDDTQQVILVRQQLQDQGLLLSQIHSSMNLIEKSSSI